MKTVADIIGYVDNVVPNSITSTNKMAYLLDLCRDIKEYNVNYDTYDTNTSTNLSIYELPSSHLTYKDLLWVGVSNSTYDVAVSQSTCPISDYQELKYKGEDEPIEGRQWIEQGSSSLYLYGLSTENKHWLKYRCIPHLTFGLNSSDSTSKVNVDDLLTDYLQNKLAAKVCRSGAFPRIDLGNNYEMEAQDLLSRVKLSKRILDNKKTGLKIGYKDWW
jgi:hypothetical protein